MIKQRSTIRVELVDNLPREVFGIALILGLSIGLLCFCSISETKFRQIHSKISNVRISSRGLIELRDSLALTHAKSSMFNSTAESRGYEGYDFQTSAGILEYCQIMGFETPVGFPLGRNGARYYVKSKHYLQFTKSL
jgi:hypothetical protein